MSDNARNLPFRPRQRLGTLFDAGLVQLGWWACVLSAARGLIWVGPLVVALLLIVQVGSLAAAPRRQAWQNVLLLGVCGTMVDSLLSGFGLMSLAGSPSPWLAPLWITALWCQFATALPAFAPLRSKPLVVALLGGIGGPLAYGGGARMGAATLHPEPWLSLVTLGLVWAVALPMMLRFLVKDPDDQLSTTHPLSTATGTSVP